jgi:hypothetical protein
MGTQLKQVLYVGLKDKDTHKQEVTKKQARTIIIDICGDCTLSDSIGVYTHDNGTIVKEQTIRVELLFKSVKSVKAMAQQIKTRLNQESIGYEVIQSNTELL